VADLGEGLGEPSSLILSKKQIAEGRTAGRASKKNPDPSLALSLDPPMIFITEALLASAVRCRMISIQFSSLLAEAIISGLFPGGAWNLEEEKYYPTAFPAQTACTQY